MTDKSSPPPGPRLPEGKTGDDADVPTARTSNNAASNGYWIHDDIGPKHYVAPSTGADPEHSDAAPAESGLAAPDLIARIDAALHAQPGLHADRVHVSTEDGRLILAGLVPSGAERARVEAVARAVARGVELEVRLSVDDGLQPRSETP